MNKQIEALKMAVEALDALEYHDNLIEYDAYRIDKDFDLDNVRNACNDALAEAEKQEPVAWMRRKYDSGTNPVAVEWDYSDIQIFKHDIPLYTHPNQELLNEYWEMGYNQCLETNKKFPIPATWQSLSDDEIWDVIEGLGERPSYQETARAIEQALKEKNYEQSDKPV